MFKNLANHQILTSFFSLKRLEVDGCPTSWRWEKVMEGRSPCGAWGSLCPPAESPEGLQRCPVCLCRRLQAKLIFLDCNVSEGRSVAVTRGPRLVIYSSRVCPRCVLCGLEGNQPTITGYSKKNLNQHKTLLLYNVGIPMMGNSNDGNVGYSNDGKSA